MGERVFNESAELADNAMLRRYPELFYEWDFEKNDELSLDIYKVTKGARTIAWWNCPDCKTPYDMTISQRAGKQKQNCPYCAGYRVNHTNSLASLSPKVAKEWHPTLNGELTPDIITNRNNSKVWWLGRCGHPWDAGISDRTGKGSGCPYCSGNKLLVGFNDIWTTNPELAKQLLNPEDGYKYTFGSRSKVDWRCSECGNIIEDKGVAVTLRQRLSCPRCSDGVSFPEKFMYNLLKEANIEFDYDTSQEWSGLKRYDFYLPEYNWIIEVHGSQHYGKGFGSFKGARNLEEEINNDLDKERLARKNKIDNYIVIDAKKPTVTYMKDSILNSDIMKIDFEVDFIEIGRLASHSFVRSACDMWNSGIRSAPKIAILLKISHPTAIIYLKRGTEIGWCDYSAEEGRKSGSRINTVRRKVVQLSQEERFIKEWTSITEASRHLNTDASRIVAVSRGRAKTAGGSKWMYKEDYDEKIDFGR